MLIRQLEIPIDTRPRTMFGGGAHGGAQPQTRGQAANSSAAAAPAASGAGTGTEQLGAINGWMDVSVSTRVTSAGETCRLPVVYRWGLLPFVQQPHA